jgi:methylmalonyl-CoA/ethylmalonyl-CoA epimerase
MGDNDLRQTAVAGAEGARLGPIGQIGVSVADIGGMTAFYRDALGLPFLFSAPGMSFFDCGGVRLMLSLPEGGHEHRHGSILYFRVANIAAAHAALVARGVAFTSAPHVVHRAPGMELWIGSFADPEGNLLAVMSEVVA